MVEICYVSRCVWPCLWPCLGVKHCCTLAVYRSSLNLILKWEEAIDLTVTVYLFTHSRDLLPVSNCPWTEWLFGSFHGAAKNEQRSEDPCRRVCIKMFLFVWECWALLVILISLIQFLSDWISISQIHLAIWTRVSRSLFQPSGLLDL